MTNAAPTTFGSDPEFFLLNAETGRIVPSVGLVGGTKDKPRMVGDYGLQEDNVMAEFTTPATPMLSQNLEFAVHGMHTVVSNLLPGAPHVLPYTGCYTEFTDAELVAAGPQAAQFGCSPDFDAYNLGARHPRVDPAALRTDGGAWRFAGGHIHVGYRHLTQMPEYVAALMCDLTLGLALTIAGERQGPRRSLYGMPGRFRPTKYGVEYRTPSNMWLHSDRLRDYLGAAGRPLHRIFAAEQDVQVRLFNEVPWNDVRAAIGTENGDEARAIAVWLNDAYPEVGFNSFV